MLASTLLKKGNGIPLVFLHGFLGTSEDWNSVCSFLPPCSAIGLDLPGHGDSPFVEELNIEIPRFHLIGYSLGGRLAASYAARHPEQIASLILMSAHPGLQSEKERKKRFDADFRWAELLLQAPIDEFLLKWYDQPLFQGFIPSLEMRKKQNPSLLAKALLHYSLAKQPYLPMRDVFIGERDWKFRKLHKTPILIPKAAHMVHLENPKEVASLIQQRLSL